MLYRLRVGLLLALLAGVAVYALKDVRSRRERVEWNRTLDVALVLVAKEDVDPAAVDGFRDRSYALRERLAAEMQRYKPGAPKPFAFTVFGPVKANGDPPRLENDGITSLAKHSWAMWRYYGDVDERANVLARAFDTRIYLVLRKTEDSAPHVRTLVEGSSEQDGRIGSVEVELGPDAVDFALIVAAHELGHTLGATDKYDAQGHTIIPDGLAEPSLDPPTAQRFFEIMARMRPTLGGEAPPSRIEELAVGPATAREIGWAL